MTSVCPGGKWILERYAKWGGNCWVPVPVQPQNELALIIMEKTARFRVLFKSYQSAKSCVESLRRYITVIGVTADEQYDITNTTTLPSMLAEIMSNNRQSLPAPDSIPTEFPLESAVKLCILDPGFPSLVNNIESIIKK